MELIKPVNRKQLIGIRFDPKLALRNAVTLGAPATKSNSPVFGLVLPKLTQPERGFFDGTVVNFGEDVQSSDVRRYARSQRQRVAHPLEVLAVGSGARFLASELDIISLALIGLARCQDPESAYEYDRDDDSDESKVCLGIRYVRPQTSREGNCRIAHGYYYSFWPAKYWFLLVDRRVNERN